MKKIFNVILIASVLAIGSNFAVAEKVKNIDDSLVAKKDKEIQIVDEKSKKLIIKLKSND